MASGWDPVQYERFRAERLTPALDLIALIAVDRLRAPMRVIDLGCGSGEPTLRLLSHLPGARIEGVDTSEAMLARAAARAGEHVSFRRADIATIASFADYDLVFSNAALHWIPDHERFIPRLLGSLAPGAQVAIQMPYNEHHPSHAVAREVATAEPFRSWLGGFVQQMATLPLERYAALFHESVLVENQLFEKLYSQVMTHPEDVVEWVKGSLLIPYLDRLKSDQQARFIDAYRERLLPRIVPIDVSLATPYLYTYRRMFLWGIKG